MKNKYEAVIFDLDGTLLDTAEDLAGSINFMLKTLRFPERSVDEIKAFLGNGIKNLVLRSLPAKDVPTEIRERGFALFREHYFAHCEEKTAPYPGILSLLDRLLAAGIRTAIVSNKNDVPVKALNAKYFGEKIPVAIGENEAAGVKKKPAPDTVFSALKALSVSSENSVYVGDSEVDYETAKNAGLPVILVGWGFRKKDALLALRPDDFADTVEELSALLLS